MQICGLQKLAMVDYPGKLAATVFTGGCNLRCPYCHNAPLVTRPLEAERWSQADVLAFLATRVKLLDGVVLTGGEPLIHLGVEDFLRRVKDMGFAVKLDSNGCYPDALAKLISAGVVDYVAMDIKNRREKYAETVGVLTFDIAPVEESVRILRGATIPFEFRTTVVRELHEGDDIVAIGQWLDGSPSYFLQQFVDSGNLIGTGYHSWPDDVLEGFSALAKPYFASVSLRGV